MAGFARLLSERARVVTPVHPGFGGTPRPDDLTDIRGLARLYLDLLDDLGLHDVTVIGNSIGGWIAAEMGAAGSDRVTGVVLVNAVGLESPNHRVVDVFPLAPAELAALSFHDPAGFTPDPAAMTGAQLTAAKANREALATYAGTAMTDPTLRDRLRGTSVPTLVLWGESDRVVTPDYGREYAEAIPGAEFRLLPNTGHVPQVETPDALLAEVWAFATGQPAR